MESILMVSECKALRIVVEFLFHSPCTHMVASEKRAIIEVDHMARWWCYDKKNAAHALVTLKLDSSIKDDLEVKQNDLNKLLFKR